MNDTPINVMIVEDSASARLVLRRMIESDPGLKVCDTARDPFEAAEKMGKQIPDVIVLDVEMPRMNGLTFLRRLMTQNPIPVVICSNHTQEGSTASLKALEMGAVEVLSKSAIGPEAGEAGLAEVCHAIRAAAAADVGNPATRKHKAAVKQPEIRARLSPDVILPPRDKNAPRVVQTNPIIGIGASTGGTVALADVLSSLPSDVPPILIVQHMPANFTNAFARRLDTICAIEVREAENGDRVKRGTAYVAPGGQHLLVERSGRDYVLKIEGGPAVSRHRPSVDVLFRALAINAGHNALGIIMTGMGDDGASSLLEMREAGARTVAQDETSCVVYGMPKMAVDRGAVETISPLHKIAGHITSFDATHERPRAYGAKA